MDDTDVILLSDDETAVRIESPLLDIPDAKMVEQIKYSVIGSHRTSSTSSEEERGDKSILHDPLWPPMASNFPKLNNPQEHEDSPSTAGTSHWGSTVVRRSFSQPVPVRGNSKPLNKISSFCYEDGYRTSCFGSRTSEEAPVPEKRRKKTKEEIERDKMRKKEIQAKKLEEKLQKKKESELTKAVSKFQREVSASMKSKCEQNLFCFVDAGILSSFGGLEETLRQVFTERNINNQLVVEKNTKMNVCWKRRALRADICDGKLIREEKLIYEKFGVTFVTADVFKKTCKSNTFFDFTREISEALPFASPQLTVVIHGVRPNFRATNLILEAYERDRTQLRFVNSIYEMASFIVRMHRAIAKLENRSRCRSDLIFQTEKGLKEGPALLTDWWSKMLKHIFRLSGEQHRAIITRFPNPFILSQKLQEMKMCSAVNFLADIRTDEGRRIGSAIARKLFFILTSIDGTEVVDE